MIVNVTVEFNKDISRLRDKKTLLAIKESLTQIETAQSLFEMASVKKLQGAPGYYRIRIIAVRGKSGTKLRCLILLHLPSVFYIFHKRSPL